MKGQLHYIEISNFLQELNLENGGGFLNEILKLEKLENRKKGFEKLELLVKARNISLYKVAGDLGFARTLFSDWKSGKSMPKTDKLLKIADYFGVGIDYFIIE